jgi:CheY-like chemotaxis protein
VSRQHKRQSLGLGLSIVKGIIEKHGGEVHVSSTLGRGSEFCFTVPLMSQAASAKPRSSLRGRHVLVVDDDPDIRALLSDRLTSEGCTVATAGDGSEALARLGQGRVDAVILDIGMPVMDGFTALREIRRSHAAVPIIMITAAEGVERAVAAVQAGAQDYLLKPFDSERFRQVIERWIGRDADR